MIKKCNFKTLQNRIKDLYTRVDGCDLTGGECKGEKNCILFQIYKQLQPKKYKLISNGTYTAVGNIKKSEDIVFGHPDNQVD